jgi:branched-chain amino acid aminotransferase
MFYCLNGDYHREEEKTIGPKNRAFRYGDALFETIYASYTNCHFLEKHLERLIAGMKILSMDVPIGFNERLFVRKIQRLLHKNHHIKGARIRIAVFRNEGGLYTPTDNSISYIIESEVLENTSYEINKQGYDIDIYPDMQRHYSLISSFKSSNCSLFTMAGIWRKKMELDDCIILNDREELCESVSSNIFLVKGSKIYTPSIKSGCVNGIMRNLVVDLLNEMNLEVDDNAVLKEEDLLEADEVFLTNSITGIRKVLAFRKKRYYSFLVKEIHERLVENTNL